MGRSNTPEKPHAVVLVASKGIGEQVGPFSLERVHLPHLSEVYVTSGRRDCFLRTVFRRTVVEGCAPLRGTREEPRCTQRERRTEPAVPAP